MNRILRHFCFASFLLALAPHLNAQTPAHSSAAAAPEDVPSAVLPDAPSALLQQSATPVQQSTAVAGETDTQRADRERREEAEREVKKQEKQRAGGVLPLFNVVISGKTVPLTPAQKFSLSFHTIIDPYTIGLAFVAGGGIGELEDSHTGYHHGPAGFFKRVGASYADNVTGNVIGNAVLPTLLHQDPRYYRKGHGKVFRRILYSAGTTFVCFGDNGHKQFNTSNVLGNFIAGGISNAYYPSDERGIGLTLENGAVVTAEGMIGAQLLEFSPDFSAYMQRRRQRKLDRQSVALPAVSTPGATTAPAQHP